MFLAFTPSVLRHATFMYLLALWPRNCSDASYTDSRYNRHCDVTIYLLVRAAKSRKRGTIGVAYGSYPAAGTDPENFGGRDADLN